MRHSARGSSFAMDVTISGELQTRAEVVGVAPGGNHTESGLRDAGQRFDAAHRFFVEIEDLLGRFSVGHCGNVDGENVTRVDAGLGFCSAISVVTSMVAPARRTKDAAICVTANMRWRRLVLLVMRTLPLARFMPFDALADGRRGTNARITAATMASAAPTQSKLESTVKSSGANGETRRVASQDRDQRLRDEHAERCAGAAEQKAFGQQHAAQRSSACAERRADREFAFAANRARENQVRNIGAGDDEDEAGSREQDEENGSRAGSDLVAEHPRRRCGSRHYRDRRPDDLSSSWRRPCAIRCGPGRE